MNSGPEIKAIDSGILNNLNKDNIEKLLEKIKAQKDQILKQNERLSYTNDDCRQSVMER